MKETYIRPAVDREYFPTPIELGRHLCSYMNIEESNHYNILEPQAGTGSLVDAIHERINHFSATSAIDCIEIDATLKQVLKHNPHANILDIDDFLQFNNYKKYDYIVMNPPYSVAEKHIEQAILYLEQNGGGTLLTQASKNFLKPWPLCEKAHALMNKHGYETIDVGQPYMSGAQRATDVEVVFIIVHVE